MSKSVYISVCLVAFFYFTQIEAHRYKENSAVLEFTRYEVKHFITFFADRLEAIANSIYALVDDADRFCVSI